MIDQERFARLVKHDYAGKGRPLDAGAGGVWWLELDDATGATCLVFGRLAGSAGVAQ